MFAGQKIRIRGAESQQSVAGEPLDMLPYDLLYVQTRSSSQIQELQLIENLVTENLRALEEAKAFQPLVDENQLKRQVAFGCSADSSIE